MAWITTSTSSKPPFTNTGRLLRETTGWLRPEAWSPDDRLIATREGSADLSHVLVRLIDSTTGQGEILPRAGPTGDTKDLRWSADGRSLYWITEDGTSDFTHLSRYDLADHREVSLTAQIPWDIDEYDLAHDGTIVLVANEDGAVGPPRHRWAVRTRAGPAPSREGERLEPEVSSREPRVRLPVANRPVPLRGLFL